MQQTSPQASLPKPVKRSKFWNVIIGFIIIILLFWAPWCSYRGGSDVIDAKPDNPDPILVPAGYHVTPWSSRSENEVDGWIPFSFEFKPRHEIEKIEFRLLVKTLPQIPETDTFNGKVDGKAYEFKKDFSDCVQKEPKLITIEIRDKSVIREVQTGMLHCCLQDDTYLYNAQMIVYYK